MQKLLRLFGLGLFTFAINAFANPFGASLCQTTGYHCEKITRGVTWETLFPDDQQRALVKRINRTNLSLRSGEIIAVPDEPLQDYMAYSPMAHHIPATGNRSVIANPATLAWGAYNAEGELVHWGPMSGGKNWCPDIKRGCRTVVGVFNVYRKGTANCKSGVFPLPKGGAPMPYCMFFKGGYALHASADLPGYNASHGCARILYEDAQWLNQNFVNVGTRVVVLPYAEENE